MEPALELREQQLSWPNPTQARSIQQERCGYPTRDRHVPRVPRPVLVDACVGNARAIPREDGRQFQPVVTGDWTVVRHWGAA